MFKRISFLILTVAMLFSLSACFGEPEYLSGTAPATVDVQPIPIDPEISKFALVDFNKSWVKPVNGIPSLFSSPVF